MMLCNVQAKISCIFETSVLSDSKSSKRPDQMYKVTASPDCLRPEAGELLANQCCVATEKLDGTSCLIRRYQDRPWLWARHDRKPTKAADKRFQAALKNGTSAESFEWNVDEDFRDIPDDWLPAGNGIPESNGHITGWVPVDVKSRSHCWHLSAVDLEDTGLALMIQPKIPSPSYELDIVTERLENLIDCTLELIGTNVNGNPYHLGSKSHPVHFLIRHGTVQFSYTPVPTDNIVDWFNGNEGQVEGIVWHCSNGKMYKLHRHHLGLKWPVDRPRFTSLPISVSISCAKSEQEVVEYGGNKLFQRFHSLSGQRFTSLHEIPF